MAVVAVMTASIMGSCDASSSDTFAPAQRTKIESFLANSGADYRITADSAYVFTAGNKYIQAGEEIPNGAPVATKGDRLSYNFEAYTFGSAPAQKPFYTNKEWVARTLGNNLDATYWNFEPREVVLGHGDVLNGIEEAFYNSTIGDSICLFMTSSIAFGQAGLGSVPPNTAVMMILNIENIE